MTSVWPVHWLAEVDSTNEEAKRRAGSFGFADQWIAAETQTAGRGRLGRVWRSPPGNLYATALFAWSEPIAQAVRIPFAAAIAVAETVELFAPVSQPKLKWPNDVRVNGAKLSGILVESGDGPSGRWIAVGMGVNLAFVPEAIGQVGACLSDLRGDDTVSPAIALDALRERFAARLAEAKTDFVSTRTAWLARAEALGKPVRVMLEGVPVEGIFKDMAEDGALLLQLPDGTMQTIRAGDVELIKETGTGNAAGN